MKKLTAFVLCLSMLAVMLAGCGRENAYVPTGDGLADFTQPAVDHTEATGEENLQDFTLAYYPSEGFNPYRCTNITNRMLFSLLYQGLFTVDRNYRVEPVLCKSYTVSEDMMTHTFYLETATFSDGTTLLASDVVASLKAARNGDYYGGRFRHIDDIEAVGEDAVRITTDCAYENLPLLLDIPIVKQIQTEESMPLGTGPYGIQSTPSGFFLKLRTSWWCSAELPLEVPSIPLMEARNATQVRDAFEFANLGISTADPSSVHYAEYRCDYELWEAESGGLVYVVCKDTSGVFADDQVRGALTFAIDRTLLLEENYNGFGVTATLMASPHSPFYDAAMAKQVGHQPEKLKQAVEEANMVGRTVRLLVNQTDSTRVATARKLAAMIEESGLKVEMLEYDTEDYYYALAVGKFDLYVGQTKLSPNMDLSEFFKDGGSLRYGGLADATLYEMCLDALENSGNYYNLHQRILQEGYLIPILFQTYSVYADRGLAQDLEPSRDHVFWYSIGKDLESIKTVETTE